MVNASLRYARGLAMVTAPAAKKKITLRNILAATPKNAARSRAAGWDELRSAGKEL